METRFRVELKNLDKRVTMSVVVYARNIAHAISKADKLANDTWPGAAVSFESWRNSRPKNGYTMR